MKQTHLVLLLVVTIVFTLGFRSTAIDQSSPVNFVIGDISFVEKYGRRPDLTTDETLRITTHLEYVEKILRQRDCRSLPPDVHERRETMLNLLRDYRTMAVFPRNFVDENKRVPCFIDREGRICAVGYLIEQTAGRGVAEEVNNRYKYARISDMKSTVVEKWIAWSGLTAEECAMIQPMYGYYGSPENSIAPWYGVTTSLLSAGSLSLSVVNAVQMTQGERGKTTPTIGFVIGASQVILGVVTFPPTTNGYDSNEGEKVLSMINIGLGTTALILSIWNLATIPQSGNISWGFYPVSTPNGVEGVGLNLTARL